MIILLILKGGKIYQVLSEKCTIVDINGKRENIHVLVEGRKILKVSREVLDIPAMEYDLSGYTLMHTYT